MPVYVVHHHHSAESCPTKNPEIVRQLASYVTPANAEKYGVRILADCVFEPAVGSAVAVPVTYGVEILAEHTVLLVLEADSPEKATNFALPFSKVGSITVRASSTCEEVAKQCLGT